MQPPKIVVAGGSGFLGRPLCRALWDNCRREVWALSRTAREIPYAHVVRWDGREPGPWQDCLEGADAVINLCGAGLPGGRWTDARKQQLTERCITPLRLLVAAMKDQKRRPKVFISASAVRYYGDRGDEVLDETAPSGADPEAEFVAEWERAALEAPPGVRTVLLRTGLVLAGAGGALPPLAAQFRCFLGGTVGTGKQFVPWISREDVLGLIVHLLSSDVSGPVNAVAPGPVSNEEFSRELASVLRRPCKLRLPGGLVETAFGELADLLLSNQRALPKRAQSAGYAFRRPTLRAALDAALNE